MWVEKMSVGKNFARGYHCRLALENKKSNKVEKANNLDHVFERKIGLASHHF